MLDSKRLIFGPKKSLRLSLAVPNTTERIHHKKRLGWGLTPLGSSTRLFSPQPATTIIMTLYDPRKVLFQANIILQKGDRKAKKLLKDGLAELCKGDRYNNPCIVVKAIEMIEEAHGMVME